MSGEVVVDHAALRRAATEHAALADRFTSLDARRADADLPAGSLGRLPSSDEIQAAFDARYHGLGEALAALGEIYDNVADALRITQESYLASDDAVAKVFSSLLSGGR